MTKQIINLPKMGNKSLELKRITNKINMYEMKIERKK